MGLIFPILFLPHPSPSYSLFVGAISLHTAPTPTFFVIFQSKEEIKGEHVTFHSSLKTLANIHFCSTFSLQPLSRRPRLMTSLYMTACSQNATDTFRRASQRSHITKPAVTDFSYWHTLERRSACASPSLPNTLNTPMLNKLWTTTRTTGHNYCLGVLG